MMDGKAWSRFRSDRIGTGLWIVDWTRFLDANRNPPRIKSGAGFRLKTLSSLPSVRGRPRSLP